MPRSFRKLATGVALVLATLAAATRPCLPQATLSALTWDASWWGS